MLKTKINHQTSAHFDNILYSNHPLVCISRLQNFRFSFSTYSLNFLYSLYSGNHIWNIILLDSFWIPNWSIISVKHNCDSKIFLWYFSFLIEWFKTLLHCISLLLDMFVLVSYMPLKRKCFLKILGFRIKRKYEHKLSIQFLRFT